MAFGEKYYTGVVWQDFQHRQLMDLLYKLKKQRATQTDLSVLNFSAAFLAMYVNHHFKLEEEYMDVYSYPDIESHKKGHKIYIDKIKMFRKRQIDNDIKAIDVLITTINDWILNHILTDDKKLGDYILSAEKEA